MKLEERILEILNNEDFPYNINWYDEGVIEHYGDYINIVGLIKHVITELDKTSMTTYDGTNLIN